MTTPDPYAVPPPDQPAAPQQPGQPYPGQPAPGPAYPPPPPPPYGYPQQGYPAQGYPAQGYPQQGYPQGYPPPGYGYQAPPRKPIDGVSVAALVFGILSIWPIGLICGFIGIRRTRPDSPQRGRGLAVAGLIISCLWAFLTLVGAIAIIAFAHSDAGHQVSDVIHGKRILVARLNEGDCFAVPTATTYGLLTSVKRQDCAGPHGAQVLFSTDPYAAYTDYPTDYPGEQTLLAAVAPDCSAKVRTLERKYPELQGVEPLLLVPSRTAWRGEPNVICAVRATSLGQPLAPGIAAA